MFTLCSECKNHYDDSTQSPECAGIGVRASSPTDAGSSHRIVAVQPVAEHVGNVRAVGSGRTG